MMRSLNVSAGATNVVSQSTMSMSSTSVQEDRPMQGELQAPGTIENRYEKLKRLKAIRQEELYRRSMEANNDLTVRDVTTQIDENNRTIHKLLLANEILVQARQSHIEDAGKKYDEENPSTIQTEINEIERLDAEEYLHTMEKARDEAMKSIRSIPKVVDLNRQTGDLGQIYPDFQRYQGSQKENYDTDR